MIGKKVALAKLQELLMEIDDYGLIRVGVGDLKGVTSYGIVLDNVMMCEKCKRLFYADHDSVPKCDDHVFIDTNRERRRSRVFPYLSLQERERLEKAKDE